MKISIITPCFNSAKTISDTIDSVIAQKNIDLEYIIVDGGSSDGTQDIVRSYGEKISKFVSEPDNGIYDAMNKGIHMATGDIVGILNSDDFYVYEHVLSDVLEYFIDGADMIYGDLDYVDDDNITSIVRKWRAGVMSMASFRRGWHPPHPSLFVRRNVYEIYGYFDDSLKISADYEFMLRTMYFGGVNASYIPKVLVNMRTGGASGSGVASRKQAYVEDAMAWKRNGVEPPFGALMMKRLRKLAQWL